MSARQTPLQQMARAAELDALRTVRPLTLAEAAEADQLLSNAYQREWRKAFRDRFGCSYHRHTARTAQRQVAA